MTNALLMVDVSSNNGPLDLRAHWKAGHRVLAIKATEGANYAWDRHAALAKQWHDFGGIVWHYHFLRPGSPAAQADYFWAHVKGTTRRYDRVVCDAEVPGVNGSQVRTYLNRLRTHTALAQVVYGPPYFLRDNTIRPANGAGLWVADYDGKVDLIPTGWQTWTAWQFTQTGLASGVSGRVDVSHLRPGVLRPSLRYGDRCFAVVTAKHLLHAHGYRGFLLTSNSYGPGFRRAVAKFKRDHRCPNHDGAAFGAWMWRHV